MSSTEVQVKSDNFVGQGRTKSSPCKNSLNVVGSIDKMQYSFTYSLPSTRSCKYDVYSRTQPEIAEVESLRPV